MDLQHQEIYKKALIAQEFHTKFLDATEKNLSYYLFGKVVPLVKKLTFPEVDLVQALANYTPEAYNPMAYLIDGFIDEIANSGFRLNVNPHPVQGKEPFQSYADQLEDYLLEIHREAGRHKFLKALLFEILSHGYFGLYTNGKKYWFLTAYDLIPGDASIPICNDQPFIVRRTRIRKAVLAKIKGINMKQEELKSLEILEDLDNVPLLDVWVKPLDLNICFTGAGQVLYHQPFPNPKRYPFSIGSDNELFNSFYTKPLISSLTPLLSKHQASLINIEESSKSIANPILLYDADAGIDVNALQRALKEGYKRIIIGKNREGNLAFRAPGQLPSYSLDMPNLQLREMMKHLGISETFFGIPTKGVRERGALGGLMKTAFRKLGSIAAIAECAFTDIDSYLLDYAQNHQMAFKEVSRFKNIEEIFQGETHFVPSEKFKGFGSEDTREQKQFAMFKWKAKLVGQEDALEEMGHSQPRKIVSKSREEMREQQEFISHLKEKMNRPPESILDKVSNRLKGKLKFRFFLMPIAEDKVLIRCSEVDQKMVAFILSDLTGKVLIEAMVKKIEKPQEQKSVVAKPEVRPEPTAPEEKDLESKTIEKVRPKEEETRGRPVERILTPGEEAEKMEKKIEIVEKPKAEAKEVEKKTSDFSEDKLKVLIRRSHVIRSPERYFDLPGFYLTDPHASYIKTGKKTLLVHARKFDEMLNRRYLLCGKDFVYGIIIVREILSDFNFDATQKFHLVSAEKAKRWWKDRPLYLYLFEFHPFETPLEYDRPDGVSTFIKDVKIKQKDIGLPYTGDLKPVALKPFKIPPPHKPEKKAFQPHEVFSIERLKEIIPEANYDVSAKMDGLRAFVWVSENKVRMFSDTGNEFDPKRVRTILENIPKIFRHVALLDGELLMEGIRRKDIAGYIHGKWEPTADQLKSLRYVCWDILFIKDKPIASLPFHKRSEILNLYLPKGCKENVCRVKHTVVSRDNIGNAVKKVQSTEGAVIRDTNSAYWATHSTYKMKNQFDVDAKVIAVEKTKVGLPIFHCVLQDGTYVGQTYAQSEVTAKPGDVIRVNVDHISTRSDGSIGWFAPTPKSWKEGKITPKKTSTTQVGIGGADRIELLKEIYLVSGGSLKEWNDWYPSHRAWKKEKMPALVESLKKKVKAGVPASKT